MIFSRSNSKGGAIRHDSGSFTSLKRARSQPINLQTLSLPPPLLFRAYALPSYSDQPPLSSLASSHPTRNLVSAFESDVHHGSKSRASSLRLHNIYSYRATPRAQDELQRCRTPAKWRLRSAFSSTRVRLEAVQLLPPPAHLQQRGGAAASCVGQRER